MPKTKGRPTMRSSREWYRIRNVSATAAELYIYDEIGYWGTTASDLVRTLSELQGVTAIDVHINSPGGDVFDGIAISNALRQHQAQVTVHVDALAASIASVIAMGGDRVVMAPGSQMMIHDGLCLCIGNAADMRETADFLDQQSDNIASIYAARAGGTAAEWRARMTAETWYTAEEAVAAGLADEVASAQASTHSITEANSPQDLSGRSWDLSVFNYAGRSEAPDPLAALGTEPAAEPVESVPADPSTTEQPAAEAEPAAEPLEPLIALDAGPDPWAELVAAYAATPADPWAALAAQYLNPSPERGDQTKEDA